MPLTHRATAGALSAARHTHPAGSARRRELAAPLSPDELTRVAARLACSIDPTAARQPEQTRWWTSLGTTPRWDAWLEGWPQGDAIELHDHGGSTAVVQVLAGRLLETWLDDRGQLRRRRLEVGSSVWLSRRHVHDVVNVDALPALSVHVYSPPLRTMTWYTATPRGGAVPLRRQTVPSTGLG